MKNNHKKLIVIFSILVLLISTTALFFTLSQRNDTGAALSLMTVPIGARLECSKEDTLTTELSNYVLGTPSITIPFKGNGETNIIRFRAKDSRLWFSSVYLTYQICNADGSGCSAQQDIGSVKGDAIWSSESVTLPAGKSLKAWCDVWGGRNIACEIQSEWNQYKLYTFCGGSKNIIAQDCTMPNSVSFLSKLLQKEGGISTFSKGEWRNYVCAWALGPTQVYSYNLQQVVCDANSKALYQMTKLAFLNGELKPIDPTSKVSLNTGEEITGYGAFVKTVECCPMEEGCCDDFTYGSCKKDCSSNLDCDNMGNPISEDATHYKTNTCINNVCTWSDSIEVECTTNAACPNGKICSLVLTNYGQCVDIPDGHYCGDGTCDKDETFENCPSDCDPRKSKVNWTLIILVGIIAIAGTVLGVQYWKYKQVGKR